MDEFDQIRSWLLSGRPAVFGPDGPAAVRQHTLLATDVNRAAKLDAHSSDDGKDGKQWVRYVTTHFPEGRGRDSADDAEALWLDWRTTLIKHNTVGHRITISHGKSKEHWHREPTGALNVNLEDMWDDFEASVDHFIAEASLAPRERRETIVKRWGERQFIIRPLIGSDMQMIAGATAASASNLPTVAELGPTPPRRPS
jgi:hypothetical protein